MDVNGKVLLPFYMLCTAATFVYLTFFDDYVYTAFNWIVAIPVNFLLASIWPIYWLIIRWIPTPFG